MPFSSLHFPFLSRFTSSPPPSLSPTAEVQASFLSRVFFHWISPLIIRGSRQPLQQSDLPELAENDQSATIAPVFAHAYRLVTAADIRRQLSSQNQSDLIQCANSASCLSAAYPSGHHHPHVSNENAHVRAPRLSRLAELCPPAIFHSKTLRALIPVSFAPFLRAAAIKPLWLAASIAQAFCIRALVERVTQSSESEANLSSRWAFVPVVLALTFAAEVMSVTSHAVFSGSMRGGMRARAALSSQIYRKTLRLSPFSLSQVSEGEIGNLLVNDTQRVLDSYTYAHFCWMGFFEIAVISVLLIIDLGLSALFGVAVLVLLVPAQISFSALVGRARAKVSVEADKRVQTMNELLSGIRTVKLSAWEPHFMNVISEQRAQEMRHLRFGAVLRALNAALFFVAPVLVALGTFTARTLIFQEPLTPAVVFSTLAFFNTLAYVLNLMPIGWLSISEALVAGKRLDAFFDLSELPPTSKIGCSDPSEAGKREEADDTELSETSSHMESLSNSQDISSEDQSCHSKSLDKNRLILRHAHFSFAQRQESNAQAVALTNISLTVADGELVCVVGPVGSGKSSLLLGILNELVCTSGFVQKHGRVAYCAQQPWIVNGTLRDNITMFGPRDKVFDSAWYGMVVEACCLKDDLDMLPASDLTEIGERGVNLSGGQKARISLARAVYSNAEIYILDDPLSAVDSAVTSHLIQSLFAQNGLLAEKAKVVVTHQLKLLPLSTRVVVLREGTVHHSGTFKELQNEGIEFSGLAELDSNLHGDPDCFQEREEINGSRALQKSRDCRIERSERGCKAAVEISDTTESIGAVNGTLELRTSIDDSDSVDKMMFSVNTDTDWSSREKTFEDNGELVEEEDRCIGRVTSSVYKVYIKAGGGYVALIMVLTAFIVPQALRQVSEWWLSRWSVHSRSNTFWEVNRFHALIFLGLAVGTAVLTLLRAAIFARQTMVASKRMHNQLLGRVLRAQPSFFETNPLGRILNRFSKDIDNMDIMLPVTTQDCLQIFFVALGALMTISVILPEFLIPLVPIIGTFLALQRLYKMTSRELKRIDGVSRSPIYSQFVESAGGLATIRAYKHETRFCTRFNEHVDKNSSAYHMFACAGRWLGIRLDALAAGVVLCTGLVVLILSQHLNPGLAGVALTQSLLITGIFQCMSPCRALSVIYNLTKIGHLTFLNILFFPFYIL